MNNYHYAMEGKVFSLFYLLLLAVFSKLQMLFFQYRNIAQLAKVKVMRKHGSWQELRIHHR